MPLNRYIEIKIDGQDLDVGSIEDLPLSISYALEDRENFQEKKSSAVYNLIVPATVTNDQIGNTFYNPSIEDLSDGQLFRSNRPAVIACNGQELLVGKAFLVGAKHAAVPVSYEFNFYGDNGDWLIDLKETTLYDCYQDIVFIFTKQLIIDSWDYDGTDKLLPYVFAPIRYGEQLPAFQVVDGAGRVVQTIEDYNMTPDYMKPSMSKYWTLWRGFKILGYRIQSDFMDSEYFRRQVMPWTWGSFLTSPDTQLDNLDFLAKSANGDINNLGTNGEYFGLDPAIIDVRAYNDSINGAFDNQGVYDYDTGTFTMNWTYLPAFNYGTLLATFHFMAFIEATATKNSAVELRIQWFKNGVRVIHGTNDNGNGNELVDLDASLIGPRATFVGQVDDFAEFEVNPGDVISAQIYARVFNSGTGYGAFHMTIDAFELDFFRIPLGGTINFANYTGFKRFKFLDFLSGIIDEFNLVVATDPINKVVYFEPMHPYSLTNDFSVKTGGYFNGNWIDWSYKQDLSKVSQLKLFSDYEREVSFRYKDDPQDGSLKVVQDRNVNTMALAKYVLPDRFKTGKREIENRFFGPTMHMDFVAWKGLSSDVNFTPQLIILLPENIANTSRDAAQNVFIPKSVYYEGIEPNTGWFFDGVRVLGMPLMYAVYYRPGGEDKPILSYADEVCNEDATAVTPIGKGLMRRFFFQRLEIMRNGQYYETYFHLNNNDIANRLHREHIIIDGNRWELVEINEYHPLKEESTKCFLRKWSAIHAE